MTTAANVQPTKDARFIISTDRIGQYYFNLVSLFPPTYHERPNGNRTDLMQMLVDMKPKFLRFPGGNFLKPLCSPMRSHGKQRSAHWKTDQGIKAPGATGQLMEWACLNFWNGQKIWYRTIAGIARR